MDARTTRSADGTTIAWYDFGGHGPDLLLAHATGFHGRIWQPVVNQLRSSFRCVSYDVRGHGASDSPGRAIDAWDWERYADDAISVIEAASLDRPFGVGHSCGGATELLVEARRNGTFRALYLFEPVVFTDDPPTGPDPERELAVRTRRRRTVFASKNEALRNFAERGPFTTLDPAVLEAYVDHGFALQDDGSAVLRCAPDDEANVYVMASAHNAFARLRSVTCPVTLAHGGRSTSFSEGHMRTVAERLAHCRFDEWPDAGHFGPLETPGTFAHSVREWFGQL